MVSLRRAIAAGLLNGLGSGLSQASNVFEKSIMDPGSEKTKLQQEFEYLQSLPPEQRDDVVKYASRGGLGYDAATDSYAKQYKGGHGGKRRAIAKPATSSDDGW